MEGEGAVGVTDGAIAATLTTHGVLGEGGVVVVRSTSLTDEVAAKAGGSLLTGTNSQRRLPCQSSWLGTFFDMDSSALLDGATVDDIHHHCFLIRSNEFITSIFQNWIRYLGCDIILAAALMDAEEAEWIITLANFALPKSPINLSKFSLETPSITGNDTDPSKDLELCEQEIHFSPVMKKWWVSGS